MLAEIEGEQELWAAQYNEKFTLPDAVYEKVCTKASTYANTQTDKPTNIHKHTRKRTQTQTQTQTQTHISFALAPGLTLKTRFLPLPPSTSTILHYAAPVCKSNKGNASTWRFGRLSSCRGRWVCLEKLACLPWQPDVHHPLLGLVFTPGFLVVRNPSHFCFGPRPSSPHAMCAPNPSPGNRSDTRLRAGPCQR